MTHMTFLGLFRRKRDAVETPPPWWERVAKLESDVKQLRLEWEETYESVNRALRKLSKREQRALQEETEPQSVPAAVQTKDQLRAYARQKGLL